MRLFYIYLRTCQLWHVDDIFASFATVICKTSFGNKKIKANQRMKKTT